jgi:hypothetical protein
MTQLTFTNPATSATYAWPANPNAEQAAVKARTIERTSNTGNVGAAKQQGDDGSLIFDYSVNVLSSAMETQLWEWYVLCRTQTVYVTDWLGEQYEGQIIALSRQRQTAQVNGNPWAVYDLQFEVWAFRSGPLYTAGVNP